MDLRRKTAQKGTLLKSVDDLFHGRVFGNGDDAVPFMKAAGEHIMALLNGVLPEYTRNKEEASFPPEPDFSFYRTPGGRIRRHEGEISTDLNDEDEEWLRRHQ